MRRARVVNETRGHTLGDRIRVADHFSARLCGLLGAPEPRDGEGLLIVPSAGVHMYGMRYPLDVILLGRDGCAVALYPGLRPWRRTRFHSGARFALELGVGAIERSETREGDGFAWTEIQL